MRKTLLFILKLLLTIGIITIAINDFGGWIMARLGITLPPTWDAMIQIITMALAIFIFLYANRARIKRVLEALCRFIGKIIPKLYVNQALDIKRRYVWITIIGIPLLFALAFFVTQYSFLTEQSLNAQIIHKFEASKNTNAYILPTADPTYQKASRQYPYSLLIEFGVKSTETIANLSITTGNDINYSSSFRGKPLQQDYIEPDSVTIDAANAHLTVGDGSGVVPMVTIHEYSFDSTAYAVNTDFSYYVYLESDKPFNNLRAQFSDALLVINNGIIQTPNK